VEKFFLKHKVSDTPSELVEKLNYNLQVANGADALDSPLSSLQPDEMYHQLAQAAPASGSTPSAPPTRSTSTGSPSSSTR
jgi:hypothetical protein